ncbi:MAG: phosphoribosylformylglycinamidine synthase subunit PurS [Microbacteriaceae bacterium]|nr:phosphoribosylformylglycinamidine synthase subunit PurS [Microbacteriaceae bacterium]
MSTVIVEVMPKPEILDPQGKAILGALSRTGHTGIASVRMGKRFEVTLDHEATPEDLDQIRSIAAEVFSNPVIEDVVSVTAEDAQ